VIFVFIASVALLAQAQDDPDNPKYKIETVNNRVFTTSITWAPDGRMFWTEKEGVVGTMSPDGVTQDEPVVKVPVKGDNEQGLLSVALDPDFPKNGFLYIFYTSPPTATNPTVANLLVRYTYTEENGKGVGKSPLQLFRIAVPEGKDLHNGGRLRFGPKDKMLYMSIGDMGIRSAGQDFNHPGGKIHRFLVANNTLVPAPGNPFPGNSTWAVGLRNTFAFDFDLETGNIFATENGPDCDDEINLITKGGNYGWTKDIDCTTPLAQRQSAGLKPLASWTPTIAPTGLLVYSGDAFPGWKGQVFYCSWKQEQLRRYKLNKERTRFEGDSVTVSLPRDRHCTIELAQDAKGYIYYTDITGIYRMVPADK
jgi:glucose/arabinose dehydrogenase